MRERGTALAVALGLIVAVVNIAMPDARRPRFHAPEPVNLSGAGQLVEVSDTTPKLDEKRASALVSHLTFLPCLNPSFFASFWESV